MHNATTYINLCAHNFNMPHAQQIWKSRKIFNKQYIFGNYSTLSDRVAYLIYNKYISHMHTIEKMYAHATRGNIRIAWRIGFLRIIAN